MQDYMMCLVILNKFCSTCLKKPLYIYIYTFFLYIYKYVCICIYEIQKNKLIKIFSVMKFLYYFITDSIRRIDNGCLLSDFGFLITKNQIPKCVLSIFAEYNVKNLMICNFCIAFSKIDNKHFGI